MFIQQSAFDTLLVAAALLCKSPQCPWSMFVKCDGDEDSSCDDRVGRVDLAAQVPFGVRRLS
jgi:hypothetical protein